MRLKIALTVIGIKLFSASAVMANRDRIFAELNNLAAVAMQYYKKPRAMGGGSNSFTGWTIPARMDSTVYGTYLANPTNQVLTITATGTEIGNDGVNFVQIVATIRSDNVTMNVSN